MLNISKISELEKPQFQVLFKQYLIELNCIEDYPYIDLYWKEENRIPLKYTENDIWYGFALINDFTIIKSNTISIAEFYILPENRRKGIGDKFISNIFNRYNGNWEIRNDTQNKIGNQFWKNKISDFTNSNYEEIIIDQTIVRSFKNQVY